jgi:hypothetical protein
MYQDRGLTLPQGYQEWPKVRSPNFAYDLLQTGENVMRERKIIYPQVTTPYTTDGNRIIRFELPNDSCYDYGRSHIQFNVTFTHTSATPATPFCGLPNGAWNIFQRTRHFSDTQLIEEKNDYGRIYSFIWITRQDPTVTQTLGTDLLGFGLPGERYGLGAVGAPASFYSIPVLMGFVNSGILPFHVMPQQYFELHLADPTTFLESNWAQTTVIVSNIEWHIDKICGSEYNNRLGSLVQQQGLKLRFQTWQTFQTTNITTQQDITISVKNNVFNGMHSVFFNTADWNNTNVTPYYQKFYQWPKLATQDYQYRIAGEWTPELPVVTVGEGRPNYMDYLRWTNSWRFDGIDQDSANISLDDFNNNIPSIPPGAYASGSFVLMGSFANDPNSGLLNNLSTRLVSPDIQIRLRLSAAPPAGTALLTFVHGETVVEIPPGRRQFTVIS